MLSHLPQVTLGHLALNAVERWYSKREVVLQKGERANSLFFLLEGRLQGMDFTTDGREVGLYFLDPGDFFGEVALVDNQPYPEFVTTLSRSQVLMLPKDIVRPVLFGVPRMAEDLCQRLAARLRQDTAYRKILGLPNPVQRVCAMLEQLMRPGQEGPAFVVPSAPTHQELAIMINASRETVTRVFQLLQSRNWVERNGQDLLVLDPDLVVQVARGELDVSK
jgi:CRP/FNR family transcriptional regulator, cyclic AMP receptor protein